MWLKKWVFPKYEKEDYGQTLSCNAGVGPGCYLGIYQFLGPSPLQEILFGSYYYFC